MQVVPLGPVALSLAGLLLVAGVAAALLINGWLRRRGHRSAEGMLWWLLLAGLVVARAVFVLRWWPQYAAHPLAIIDVRDGGFSPWAGLLAVLVGALVIARLRHGLQGALVWSVLGGILVWSFGSLLVLQLAAATQPPLPTLVLHDLDARPRPLQALRGEPAVINLWATWCGPCRKEMPVLAEAQRERTGVRFVFANQGESPAKIRAFLADTGLQLDGIVVDPFSRLSQDFAVRGYPTTLFFDAQGSLRSIHTGVLSRATLAAQLRHITPGSTLSEPTLSGISP